MYFQLHVFQNGQNGYFTAFVFHDGESHNFSGKSFAIAMNKATNFIEEKLRQDGGYEL